MKAELWIEQQNQPEITLRLWPTSSIPSGLITEGKNYIFLLKGISNLDSIDIFIDEELLLALKPINNSIGRWLWSPGFYSGIVNIDIRCNNHLLLSSEFILDTDNAKLTRNNFNQMITDILEDSMSLFSISPFRTSISRGTSGELPPIARLEYIKSKIQTICETVNDINEQPVRILSETTRFVNIHKLKHVDSQDLEKSYRQKNLCNIPSHLPYSKQVNGLLPYKIIQRQKRVGLDIGEHRAIKNTIKVWASWLKLISLSLKSCQSSEKYINLRREIWSGRCSSLARKLNTLLELPMFSEVADTHGKITLTPIFRWNNRYRKFYQLYHDINLGLARVQGDFLQIPISRTYELYELWAFLRILRASFKIFGKRDMDISKFMSFEKKTNALTLVSSCGHVDFCKHFRFCFQRKYREYWLTANHSDVGSFTREMIPDISFERSWENTEKKVVIVFDAKYRIETELNDAIVSLHTYRDALVQDIASEGIGQAVVGAYILTPHIPGERTLKGQTEWKSEKAPALFFHPIYRENFRFGAITLRPEMNISEIERSLVIALSDAKQGDIIKQYENKCNG